MPIHIVNTEVINPVKGCQLGTANAGIRYQDREDTALIALAKGSRVAASFTTNAFCAAPVTVAKQHINRQAGQCQYLLINSGNANACTGQQGIDDALSSCQAVAKLFDNHHPETVLPFSTGVIGERLPVKKLIQSLPNARQELSEYGWEKAAKAIMTTDTVPKCRSALLKTDDGEISITGIAKGSGMINPSMTSAKQATMLAFIATDADIPQALLDSMNQSAIEQSFNSITVDGDMSTNDACVLISTRLGVTIDSIDTGLGRRFIDTLNQLYQQLAQDLVRDAEGASKFVTLDVEGALDSREAMLVAKSIGHSPLVKTALFASDPNWGRIVAAIGYAGVRDLDANNVDVHIQAKDFRVTIVEKGQRCPGYTEAHGQSIFSQPEINIIVNLNRGDAKQRLWTCDLSHDYVDINASYRS